MCRSSSQDRSESGCVPGEGALAAEGGDHRGVGARSASAQQPAGAPDADDAAARDDRRAARPTSQSRGHRGQLGAGRRLLAGRVEVR